MKLMPFQHAICGLILAFFSLQSLAHSDISGQWQHDGHQTSIKRQSSNQYQFCNENDDCANGRYNGSYFINVPSWGVTGTVKHSVIYWSNGTKWNRLDAPHSIISGTWYHRHHQTSIRMAYDGYHFLLTNEIGQSHRGYLNGRTLKIPELLISGQLNQRGNKIRWSNGTVWKRHA